MSSLIPRRSAPVQVLGPDAALIWADPISYAEPTSDAVPELSCRSMKGDT